MGAKLREETRREGKISRVGGVSAAAKKRKKRKEKVSPTNGRGKGGPYKKACLFPVEKGKKKKKGGQ